MGQYKNNGQSNYLGFDRYDVVEHSFECSYCGKTFDRDEVLDLDNERCDECCSDVDVLSITEAWVEDNEDIEEEYATGGIIEPNNYKDIVIGDDIPITGYRSIVPTAEQVGKSFKKLSELMKEIQDDCDE